ncbi:MAG: DUF3124 domain-containing protein [Methylococcaceae bacterium]|nr:DUF3124 domain-containing protein [Methylococcaceae bacterium]
MGPVTVFRCSVFVAAIGLLLLTVCPPVGADETRLRGQLLYLPVYSEVPFGDRGLSINLSATVTIRNTNVAAPITIKRADYFGASGVLIRSYLKQPEVIRPMASVNHVVNESDRSGGSSASFLLEWQSDVPVTPPVVEAIMVNLTYNTGFAFSSQARVLEQRP